MAPTRGSAHPDETVNKEFDALGGFAVSHFPPGLTSCPLALILTAVCAVVEAGTGSFAPLSATHTGVTPG